MYHRFNENKYPSTNIEMDIFKKQINIIKNKNYEFEIPESFDLSFNKPKTKKKILITIDDAFSSFYENAWPFLKENKIPFILFVSTQPVGKRGYMTWEQIKEVEKENFAFIGNHSHSHEYLLDFSFTDFKKDFSLTSKIYENTDKKNYKEKFEAVKAYLKKGDCYQVNLSKKYMVKTSGDPWDFYCKFRYINKSPFMAYLQFDGNTLLSGSPERFLKSNNGLVSTRPIKGTSARGSNAAEDKKNINILKNSSKEQAENLMIVDLLRNDLGVNCKSGSIKVDELFVIESYPNVHHLVSSIKGLLKDESSVFDLFNDAFPGGSITGAPKKRAMEIINELESHARDLYCGSIVYFSFDGKLDSNIAIRSMIHNDDTIHFYSGGGLTIQSSLDAEYKEIEDKVNNIKKTILFFKRKDNA